MGGTTNSLCLSDRDAHIKQKSYWSLVMNGYVLKKGWPSLRPYRRRWQQRSSDNATGRLKVPVKDDCTGG